MDFEYRTFDNSNNLKVLKIEDVFHNLPVIETERLILRKFTITLGNK